MIRVLLKPINNNGVKSKNNKISKTNKNIPYLRNDLNNINQSKGVIKYNSIIKYKNHK